jgi:hypothetical protein
LRPPSPPATPFRIPVQQGACSLQRAEAKGERSGPLPSFRLDGVTLTFNVDADYEIVRTQLTENVIGIVEGIDPQLKSTYVVMGLTTIMSDTRTQN